MSISRTADKPRSVRGFRPAGRRWMGVDEWLKRYDDTRDPHGVYGCPGRNPQNIIVNVERAA